MKDKKLLSKFALLIDTKIELIKELIKLSNSQNVVINEEKWDELQSLLDKKEEIKKNVDKFDQDLNPIIENIIAEYKLNRDEWVNDLQEIEEVSENIKTNLKSMFNEFRELKKIDDENLAIIQDKRMELTKGMKRVQHGRKVNKGYINTNRIYSTFIDKRS